MKENRLVSPAGIAALTGTLALLVPALALADSPLNIDNIKVICLIILMVGMVFVYLFTLYLIFSFPAVKIYGEQWKHAIRPYLKKTALYILLFLLFSFLFFFMLTKLVQI